MTNVVKKVSINGQVVPIGGGASGEEHEVITQAAYDQLTPAEKSEKVYMIKESGTPSTVLTAGAGIDISNDEISADMSTAVYDNTTSGATATNVQDAIDEVFQSVSNGKTLIAAAITDKGVSTAASDSFQTMASNIESLEIATDAMKAAYNIGHGSQVLFKTITGSSSSSSDTYVICDRIYGIDNYELYRMGTKRIGRTDYYNYNYTVYKFYKDGTHESLGDVSYTTDEGSDGLASVDNTGIVYYGSWGDWYNDSNHGPAPTSSDWTASYSRTQARTAYVGFNTNTCELITTNLPKLYEDQFTRSNGYGPISVMRDGASISGYDQHITLPYTINNVDVGNYVHNITITI